MEKYEINHRVRQLFEYLGFGQNQFAEQIGISTSRMSNIVKNRNRPDSEMLQLILFRFRNVNADWLLTGEGEIEQKKPKKLTAEENIFALLMREKDQQLIALAAENGALKARLEALKKKVDYTDRNLAAEP